MKELTLAYNLSDKIMNSLVPLPLRKLAAPFYAKGKGDPDYWAGRPAEGERGATNYIGMDATSEVLIAEVASRARSPEDKILDLGCNVGRHLNGLREKGFKNLYGIDLSKAAREVSKQAFPELNVIASFKQGTFEDYLKAAPDKSFDIVYTHGATVEHVHPAFPLVQEICRVTRNCVVFATVYLGGSTYPRFWIREFEKNGFYIAKLAQPEKEWAPASQTNRPVALAVFKPVGSP
jgi:SAM-dependent methyltransferase